jgi:hypothetical protein
MKVNMKRFVKTALGTDVMIDAKTKATLGDVAAVALGRVSPKDQREGINPDESYRRGKLAERIRAAKGEVELSSEEITLVKAVVANYWSPEVVGPTWDALEGK